MMRSQTRLRGGAAVLVALMLLGEAAVALVVGQAGFAALEPGYRIVHLLQMLLLFLLAWSCRRASMQAPWLVAALGLSLCGDLINSFLLDLSFIIQPQTLLSALPFGLAHLLYISVFLRLMQAGRRPASAVLMLVLVAWPLLALGLWQLIVDQQAGPLLRGLSLGYSFIVVLMALSACAPVYALGRTALWSLAGGLVFLASDMLFGAWLTAGQARPLWVSQAIWISYFMAQCLLIQLVTLGSSPSAPNAERTTATPRDSAR